MSDTRTELLIAANQIVLREGVVGLTLEAVAAEAGVSKGGLLYHFPNKEALITGMLERLTDDFEAQINRNIRAETGIDPESGQPLPRGAWLRAYLRATFDPEDHQKDISAGLLAAGSVNPDLLEPMTACFQRWQDRAEADGLDTALATAIRLAADGLWFTELLDLAPLDGALRGRVLASLLRLTESADDAEEGGER